MATVKRQIGKQRVPSDVGIIKGILNSLGIQRVKVDHLFTKMPKLKGSKYQPHQGEGEKARRRRQIAKGQLTAANGLVSNQEGIHHG